MLNAASPATQVDIIWHREPCEDGAGEPSRRVGARVNVDPVGKDLRELAGRVAVDNHLRQPAGRSQEVVTDPEEFGRGPAGRGSTLGLTPAWTKKCVAVSKERRVPCRNDR